MIRNLLLIILLSFFAVDAWPQKPWNGKQAAVVLTYDDGIDIDLDTVIPQLDSFGLKGTFYVIAGAPIIPKRFEEWRRAADNGHELGNHTLKHPCTGGPGREFVTADTDLRNYTVGRAVKEIRLANSILKGIDGKERRTFAYPCGDLTIHDTLFYRQVEDDFVAARGVQGEINVIGKVDTRNINAYFINGHPAKYMTDLVDKAIETRSMIVFLFHGVGGGHPLNVGLTEHRALLQYLVQQQKEVWVPTMVDAATWARSRQR
jgi:peptidoglycan/xylan/chitin deacetylase (PgdA/CDA1 family)